MLVNVGKGNSNVETTLDQFITMDKQIYNDLIGVVKHYDSEVSGCGLVERIDHKETKDIERAIEYKILEIFLPEEQKNTGASTDIDVEMVHKMMTRLIKQNKDVEKLKLHWHSHDDMSVFHSGTDEDNYKDLNNGDYLVSFVLNKSKDILGRVDYYKYGISISGLPVYITIDTDDKMSDDIRKSIKKLDKYTKDNESVTTYKSGYTIHDYTRTDLKYDGDWRSKLEKRAEKFKKYRASLGIDDKTIESMENCRNYDCETCEHYPHPCMAYNGGITIDEVDDWDTHAYYTKNY